MDGIGFAALIVTGFVGCDEFSSFALVQPILARLPDREFVMVEQGLLRTLGRVMPLAMTAAPVLVAMHAAQAQSVLAWIAFSMLAVALVTTIVVNVRINAATGKWDADAPPAGWRATRDRWCVFQGVRASLQLLGFIVLAVAITAT